MKLTPHKPLLKIVKIDETDHWCKEVTDLVRRIFGVYVFDARKRVPCCEQTPSFELHFLESQADWSMEDQEPSEEIRDQVDNLLFEGDSQTEGVTYIHCSHIENAPTIKEGFCPDGTMGVYKIYHPYKYKTERDDQDKADAEYDAKSKEEWENIDYSSADDEEMNAWKEESDKATDEAIEELFENMGSYSF